MLRQARARRTNWVRGSTGNAGQRLTDAARPALKSVADIERERAEQSAAEAREAAALVQRARHARDAGKPGVAAVYYAMAAHRADAALRPQIEQEAGQLQQRPAAAGDHRDKPSPRVAIRRTADQGVSWLAAGAPPPMTKSRTRQGFTSGFCTPLRSIRMPNRIVFLLPFWSVNVTV